MAARDAAPVPSAAGSLVAARADGMIRGRTVIGIGHSKGGISSHGDWVIQVQVNIRSVEGMTQRRVRR